MLGLHRVSYVNQDSLGKFDPTLIFAFIDYSRKMRDDLDIFYERLWENVREHPEDWQPLPTLTEFMEAGKAGAA